MAVRAIEWAWRKEGIDSNELLVLLCLADHASPEDARCFPSVRKICERTRLADRSVRRILRRLEDLKLLRTSKRAAGANEYILAWSPPLTQGQPPPPPPPDPGSGPYILTVKDPMASSEKGGKPLHQKVIDYFRAKLERKLGETPVNFNGGAAARIASQLARAFPAEEIKLRVDRWFDSTDPHISKRSWRVEDFGSYFNRLAAGPILARKEDRRSEWEDHPNPHIPSVEETRAMTRRAS